METLRALFLLVVIPGSLIAGPVKNRWSDDGYFGDSKKCGSTCTESSKFGYEEGKTYRYAYEARGVNSVPGASDESATVHVSANAYIHVISKCELALTVSDVTFKTSDPDSSSLQETLDQQFTGAVEEFPLDFSFQDGRIEQLCPSESEAKDVLNFKRGILSAFQNSMNQHQTGQSLREIDVIGNCPTEYSIQKGWKSTQITKTKDLLGCSDRHHYHTSLRSTPFHIPDTIQSVPLLKGDLKCSQTISKEGILSMTTCTESLIFRPFSKKESGAKTETSQKLEFIESQSRSSLRTRSKGRRTSLIFEHSHPYNDEQDDTWAVKDKLDKMCKLSAQGISKEVPELFSEMVYLMKGLPYEDLKDLWSAVNNGLFSSDSKERAKQFFLDSLPTVGTKDSVKLMVDHLLSDIVTDVRASLWIKSFTFLQYPNEEMIESFSRLLSSKKLRLESLLPVTSAIHHLCLEQNGCQSNKKVVDIVNKLDNILGRDCKSTDENLILTALRAIGNLGFSDNIVSTLENCIEMSENTMNVRVMAVQAFRGITCQAERKSLMEIFMNKEEDSELRINAYLGLMMCPSRESVGKVKDMLENEEINQVGSFVWTHLTNLAETSSPHKQDLKRILQDEKLKKEFDLDKKKFSRNYEMSFFSDRLGLGGVTESNLIWSSSSFLPRSAMVNLTVDVLGHSVNLFEAGGRVQGLQKLLYDYIGNKLKKSDDSKPKQPSPCFKQGKMDGMKEKHAVKEDELTASVYLRMFGNELIFKHFTKDDMMAHERNFNAKEMIASLAKGKDISITHSAMFLDSTVVVPTIAGMALQLSVNGTASMQLKAKGKMDLRRLSLKKLEINFDIAPSGAIQFGGQMTLSAWVIKSGLRITTTMNSKTAFTGGLDLTNGQVLKITADTPGEKLVLFNVESEFYIIHNKIVRQQKMLEEKAAIQQRGCSDPYWVTGVGYQLCGHVSFVNATMIKDAPYFPLTGPLSGSLILHKRDAPKGLKLLVENIQNSFSSLGRISIDTPSSNVDRALVLSYFIDTKANSYEFEVTSPWKKMLTKGSYSKDENSFKASASLTVDKDNYEWTWKVDKKEQDKKTIWSPSLQVLRPENSVMFPLVPPEINIGGTVTISKEHDEVAVDLDVVTTFNPKSMPIKLQANYINKKVQKTISGGILFDKKDGYSATFQVLQSFIGKNDYPSKIKPTILISAFKARPFLLSGNIELKKNKLLKANVQVMMENRLKEPISLTLKATKSNSKLKGNGKISSQFAVIKSKGFIDVVTKNQGKKGPLLTTRIITSYTLPTVKDKRLRKNLVILSSKIHNRSSKSLLKYDANVEFESRNFQDASFVLNADMSHKDSFTKSMVTFKSGSKSKNRKDKSRQLTVETTLDHQLSKEDVDIKYDIQILYPLKAIEWQINGKHEHHLKETVTIETYNSFIFAKGKSSELRFKVDSNNDKSLDYVGLLEFNYPTFKVGDQKYDGRSYQIISTIVERPENKYTHTLKINVNKGAAHSMVTTFMRLEDSHYDLNSVIVYDGEKETKITFKNSHMDKKVETSLKIETDDKIYQADTSATLNKNNLITTWDVLRPDQKIQGSLEAGINNKREYFMNFLTLLDADKDITNKIAADYVFVYIDRPKYEKYNVDMSLITPFEGFKIFVYKDLKETTEKEEKSEFKIVWKEEKNEMSFKSWLLTPPSFQRFQYDYEIITPSEMLRMFRVEIRHKFDGSKYLETSVKSKYNNYDIGGDLTVFNKWYDLQRKRETKFEIKLQGAQRNSLEFKIGDFPQDLSFNPISPYLPKFVKFQIAHMNSEMKFEDELLYIEDNSESKINQHTTYTQVGKMVNLKSQVNVILKKFMIDPIYLEMTHASTLTNMNTTFLTKWGNNEKVELDIGATVLKHDSTLFILYSGTPGPIQHFIYKQESNNLNGWSGSSSLKVNKDSRAQYVNKYEITKTEFKLEHTSPTMKYDVKAEYEHFPYTVFTKISVLSKKGWEDIVFDGSVTKNNDNDWSSDMRLVTPFNVARNVDIKGNLKELVPKKWMLNGDISLEVRKNIKFKFIADTDKWSKIDVEIENPWKDIALNVINKRQKRSLKTVIRLKYDQDQEIIGKLNGRFKFPEKSIVSFDLSTPFDDLKSLNIKGNLHKANKKWNGLIDLKSSNNKFKFFKLAFENEFGDKFFDNSLEIDSSAFDKVVTGVLLDFGENPQANLTISTPYINRTMIGFKLISKSSLDFQKKIFGEIHGYNLDMDIGLKHNDLLTKAWLTFDYPGADKGFVKTSLQKTGKSLMDFDAGGELQIGKHTKPYKASAQFSYVEGKTALGTTFESPFTKSFSYLLKNEVGKSKQTATLYGKYGDDYMLDLNDMHEWSDFNYINVRRTGYLYKGVGHTSGYNFEAEWSDEGEEFSLTSTMDGEEISIDGSHIPAAANEDDKDTVDVYITTPYDNFKALEIHFYLKEQDKNYDGKLSLEYMDDKEAELIFDVKTLENKIVANGELSLPINGYEKNTITYTQITKRKFISVTAEGVTGLGEHLKVALEMTDKEEFILNLVGPIKQFKSLKIAAKYNEYNKRLNGDVQLRLTLHPKAMTLEYDIDVNDDPAIMTFRLRSPYENFQRADLTIKQRGNLWDQFTTTSTLTSEKIGTVTLETGIDYKSQTDFEGTATLTSLVKGMENSRLHLKTYQDNKKVLHSKMEIGWGVDNEILIQNTLITDGQKMNNTIEISTPFEEFKSLSYKFFNDRHPKTHRGSLFFRLNDLTRLDADMSYNVENHEWNLEMRKPRPMSVKLEGELKERAFDGKMLLNWDKSSPESQFEFNTHMSDKSQGSNIDSKFYLKVIHPVRIMAVEHILRKSDNEMQTAGLITWDENKGNTFSYDIGYTDRSTMYTKMYDAHVKMGVPQRSVKLLGSYGDTGSSRTLTSTALWDADQDETKKITMSTSHEYSKQIERFNMNLNLPSINKQLNMGVGLKRDYGSTIFDSKTEISYSSDSSKNIHILTKIMNTVLDKEGKGDYNYTMETGFKHEITNIDLQSLFHVARVNDIMSAGNRFTYLTHNNEQKVLAWHVETDADKSGTVMITTPVKSLNVIGKRFIKNGSPSCSLELFEEGEKTLEFTSSFKPRTRQLDAALQYDRDDTTKKIFINGVYLDEQAAEWKVYDTQTVYTKVNIKLNNSYIIHYNIVWKPTVPQEFTTFMGTKVTAFSYTVQKVWDVAVKNVGTEVKAKYLRVSQELGDEMSQVFALIRKEMEIFNVQLETLMTQIRRIYNRNDLHLRDMGQQIEDGLVEILGLTKMLVKSYQSYKVKIDKTTEGFMKNLKNYPISLVYNKSIEDMFETLKEIRIILEKALQDVVLEMKRISQISFKKYVKISRQIDSKLNSYFKSKQKLAVFKQMMQERERLARMGADYRSKEMEMADYFFLQTQAILEDQFHDLMKRSEFLQMHAMSTEIYQQVISWNPEKGVGQTFTRVLDLSKNLILMEMAKIKNMMIGMKKSRVTYYNPQQGELQVEIHLPFELESLTKPPEIKIYNYAKDAYKWIEGKLPDLNATVWDHYYKNAPSNNPDNWLPPFDVTGYVLGSQHIITFDKAHVDFLSACSHVLVRDMVNDTFSVILNYDKNPKRNGVKSICLNIGKSLSLTISKDYKLKVNNQETEMPFVNEFISVVRDGSTVRMEYINGIVVVSDPNIDLYKVTLNGWFHGRTAGLFGNYDNEMQNDKAMADRLDEFEVNRKYCNNKNVAVKPESSEDVSDICSHLFMTDHSKYRPCFKQVDPSAFLRICQVYMSKMSEEEAVHRITEQYRFVCRDAGIFMGPLEQYIPCNKEKPFLVQGTDPLYQSADVVIVMEDTKCNNWASASLPNIVMEINKALGKSGMKNNRFGLAGYSGLDTTVRTLHGEYFGKPDIFLKAVETLRFDDRENDGDLVIAVKKAMKYPFRPGVAKVLVLSPCTPCQVGFLERNLDTSLMNNGFMVHILHEQAFSRDSLVNQKSFRVYGMDNTNSITNKAYTAPLSAISLNDDYCNVIARTTNGSVFDTTYLIKSKSKIQREFIKSFANKVGWSTKLPNCQKCQCNDESHNIECQLCDTSSHLFYLPTQPYAFNRFVGNLHDLQFDFRNSLDKLI